MQSSGTARVRDEEGFTLIEVVITVALLSIAFVGILSAVGGLVLSGVQNKSATAVQAGVRSVSATIQSYDATPYTPCGSGPQAAYNTAAAAAAPAGLNAAVTNVQYWDGTSTTPATFGACPAGGDQGLELITVQVSTGNQLGGAFTRSLAVLKRRTP